MMPLPPYGRRFVNGVPSSGFRVFIGPSAWSRAKRTAIPAMVLPEGNDPAQYHWPVAGGDVIVIEYDCYDTDRLERTEQVLLESGARMVYLIRTAHLEDGADFWGEA